MTELPFARIALQSVAGAAEALHAAGIDGRVPCNDAAFARSAPCDAMEQEWGFELSRPPWSVTTPDHAPPIRAAGEGAEVLDLHDLPAPEPLVRALDAVDRLQPGQVLKLITPLLPWPLLQVLASRGLDAQWHYLDGGSVMVVIGASCAAVRE